jgi:hypothetical protein
MPSSTTFLFLAVGLAILTVGLVVTVRQWDQQDRDAGRHVYRLSFPRGVKTDQVVTFLRSLAGLRPPRGWLLGVDSCVFEVIAWAGGIEHRLRVPAQRAEAVLAQLRTAIPGVGAVPVENPAVRSADFAREIRLTDSTRPIRTDQPEAVAASILTALESASLREGEVLTWQWTVWAVPTGQPTPAHTGQTAIGWLNQLLGTPTPSDKQDRAARRTKLAEPMFGAVGRVGAASAARGRSGQLVGRVVGTAHQLSTAGARLTTRLVPPRQAAARIARATTPLGAPPAHLNARELATAIAWPIGDNLVVPGLRLGGSRPLPPAAELPQTGRVVGTSTWPGSTERPVAISPADSLMHMIVTGPTGSGKSTLLLNMLVQDVTAGRGAGLLDPSGDLAHDVLDRVPEPRLGDVIHLDVSDEQRPVGLNLLAASPDDAELRADQVLAIIKQRATSWGPQLEEILANSLVALAASGLTLVELRPLLEDEGFRRPLVVRLDPVLVPGAAAFFRRFEQWSDEQRHQAIGPVLNKISPVTGRRMLRNVVGQTEATWTMPTVLAGNKILLVSLPTGRIGAYAAELLGGVVVSMLWNAVLERAAVDRQQRQPSYTYIDEAPRFLGGAHDLTDALARARGHGHGLVLATQHLDQFPAGLRRTVLSEARSKIAFQPGADDAGTLARHFGPLVTATDLQALPARTAMAALVVGGQVAAPVTIATAPPPPPTGLGQQARDASRQTYGRDRDEVEQAIQARRRPPEAGPRRTRRVP